MSKSYEELGQALMTAVAKEHDLKKVQELVAEGADVNYKQYDHDVIFSL